MSAGCGFIIDHTSTPSENKSINLIVETEAIQIRMSPLLPIKEPPKVVEFNTEEYIRTHFQAEIIVIAKIVWREARGVKSLTEQACVIWTLMNRYDSPQWNGTILELALAPSQFAYEQNAPTTDDFGRDIQELVVDVLVRWFNERYFGKEDGRVLPNDYFYFIGDDSGNYFSKKFMSGIYWDYSLPSPYEAS